MTGARTTVRLLVLAVAIAAAPQPAEAICGRKSCVVGSAPAYGGGYDPFAGMGGMVDMMFGIMGAIEAQQQQLDLQNAQEINNLGIRHFESGDYVAAVAAFQQALRLKPNDPAIRANLQRAEAELAALRQREAARQQAEREALQRKISGMLEGLGPGLDAAVGGVPASPPGDGIDFAPSGTSFFGTGGGKSAPAVAPGRPAAGSQPRYEAAVPPGQQGLDFADGKEPLFQKGSHGSGAPPAVGGAAARPSAQAPAKPQGGPIDFSTSTAPARPGTDQVAAVTPDPITYQSTGFRAWAVRTFADPLTSTAIDLEMDGRNKPMPEPAAPPHGRLKDLMPDLPLLPVKRPLEVTDTLSPEERRRREIVNLAFDRIGTGQYENAMIFLDAAKYEAGGGATVDDARTFVREVMVKDVGEWPAARPDPIPPERVRASAIAAYDGYKALSTGDYEAAGAAFAEAYRQVPDPEWLYRMRQADAGLLLLGR